MSTPFEPSPQPADDRRHSVKDLMSEVFPDQGSAKDTPPIPDDILKAMLGAVVRQNRSAKLCPLTALSGTANPFLELLRGRKITLDVLITVQDSELLAGTLRWGYPAKPASSMVASPFRDFEPVLAAKSPSLAGLLAASDDEDEDDDEEMLDAPAAESQGKAPAPLLLLIPNWPVNRSLRGVDVIPLDADGDADAANTVILTTRRIRGGFELHFQPEEELTLRAASVSVNLCVVTAGGDNA